MAFRGAHRVFDKSFDWLLSRGRRSAPDRELPLAEAEQQLRLHGDFALAWKTLDPRDLRRFGDERGYIAYAQKASSTVALGDPVAAPEAAPALVGAFISAFGKPAFIQISRPTAELLANAGWMVTPFGCDTVLDLATYRFAGKDKEGFRVASNWLARNGFRIEERRWSDAILEALASITAETKKSRLVNREMTFLNRGVGSFNGPAMRYFFLLDPVGEAVAAIIFDPLWRGGRIIGYVAAVKRRRAGATAHAELGVMRHAIETFQTEGLEKVRLGLSPFAGDFDAPGRPSPALLRFFAAARRSGWINGRVFNIAGIAAFKRRFRGVEEPLYVATVPRRGPIDVVAAFRLSKLI